MNKILTKIIRQVQNPARYLGKEINAYQPESDTGKVTVALGYPDIYEVGMSSLGVRILYGLLNESKDACCERFFAPAGDLEELLRKNQWPLFTLESGKPVADFEIVAFSLSSELNYTNLVNLLDLAKIPVLSADRGEEDPLVVIGGSCTVNPFPLSGFGDVFVIGEGEEVITEIVQVCKNLKGRPRLEKIEALAKIPGLYVPGATTGEVRRRIITDFNNCYFPVRWLVPLTEIVHDRITLEIMRGCPQSCRFCAARSLWHPVRCRCPERVMEIARQAYRWSGYEEISLLSLSSGDHPRIDTIVEGLIKEFAAKRVAISFPSLRADTFSFELARSIKQIRKTGLTFAPETSQRLRQDMGKKISDEEIINLTEKAKQANWRQIKLYFMIGLPGEKETDIQDIVKLVQELSRILTVNVAFNTFVPKCHTPLEREALCSYEEFLARTNYIKKHLETNQRVKLSFHPYRMSQVETFLGRGDEKLSRVILNAWRQGARMENWSEHFSFSFWENAFLQHGINLGQYCGRLENQALIWHQIKV